MTSGDFARQSTLAIPDTFIAAVERDPEALLVIDGAERLTRADIAAAVAGYQAQLLEHGLRPGDVVTMQLPNWWQTLAMSYAVWALGGVVNPVPTIFRARELATILGLARPRIVVAASEHRDARLADNAAAAAREASLPTPVLPVERQLGHHSDSGSVRSVTAAPDDLAMVMFTSGTTGLPKGVLHSHRTLLYESASIADLFAVGPRDRIFMPSPLAHITGLLYGVLMPLQTGAPVVLQDRWDAGRACDLVEEHGCTVTVAATPFLHGLTEAYARDRATSALRTFICGGADIPAALVRRAEQVLGATVARAYGSTEMPTLCATRPNDPPAVRYATEGRPIGGARARLAESDDGTAELQVQGPELFVGYLDETDTARSFTDDGWFRTGDAAAIDADGVITITGRIKDIVVRGGENISAKEIEDLILELPEMGECAVVGLPDPYLGEKLCAVVVTRGGSVTLDSVTDHLESVGIARQKFPEILIAVEALPRTPSGKIQKFRVREEALRLVRSGEATTRVRRPETVVGFEGAQPPNV